MTMVMALDRVRQCRGDVEEGEVDMGSAAAVTMGCRWSASPTLGVFWSWDRDDGLTLLFGELETDGAPLDLLRMRGEAEGETGRTTGVAEGVK